MNRMVDVTTTDPITLEVVRNKVDGIANEMQSTLLRSSFSTVVKEGLDASASLFTPDGETLAQAIAIPIHLATLIPIVETISRTFPIDEMKPGDLYIMNDPYLGGTHLPDIAIVMPVFFDGRPIAFSAAMTHHQDVGGMSPGSVPPNATEIYQEGIRIPPLKLREGNEFNHTLVEMLKLNVRVPQVFMGDIGALSLGAALGVVAVIVRQEIVLAIMGGVFVVETLSVIIQVASFKLTGKRVFRMAPLHHHFELKGWAEPKVIVRFWIITVILVLIGLVSLKIR